MMTKGYYTILDDRSVVAVRGADARDFLQGLITQDISALGAGGIAYGALLTAQGKLEHDFIVHVQDDGILLECESTRAGLLEKRLLPFRLRKQVSVASMPVRVLVIWGHTVSESVGADVLPELRPDPRPLPGTMRKIIDQDFDKSQLNDLEEVSFDFYHRLCIAAKVPLGSLDIAWGEDSAADINLEYLNGVSYTKGCYLGQELTSRMHHRALAKKSLYAVRITGEALPAFTDIVAPNGPLIGEMRSSSGDMGLAILRHDQLAAAAGAGLVPLGTEEDAA